MGIPVEYFQSHGTLSYYQSNGIITDTMLQNTEVINGHECITVMPSFLLEGLWNLAILIFLFLYRKRKKFDGELSMIYIMGYGIGRFIIEGNRTDSLMIGPLKVSQVVAVLCIVTGLAVLIRNYLRLRRGFAVQLHPWKKELPYYENVPEGTSEGASDEAPSPKKKSGKTAKNKGISPDEPTVEDTVEESGGKSDKEDDN
jgi:phosphatidylglycerol:prolipoprotein diacylglycerol transferase